MITIKMHQGKWRIIIGDEVWEFADKDSFDSVLAHLIEFKDKFGRINKSDKDLIRMSELEGD